MSAVVCLRASSSCTYYILNILCNNAANTNGGNYAREICVVAGGVRVCCVRLVPPVSLGVPFSVLFFPV